MDSPEGEKIMFVRRWKDLSHVFIVFNFNCADVKMIPPVLNGRWKKWLDSSERIWNDPGSLLRHELTPGDEIIMRVHSLVMYSMVKP